MAGFLESQGEFTRSVAVMSRLMAEYPPEPYVAAADYATKPLRMTREEFSKLTPADRLRFVHDGGKLV
mgnify:CR=1 FL=1